MATFDLTTPAAELKAGATRNFYATVGATDLAVHTVREYVADVQKDMQTWVSGVEIKPEELRKQAVESLSTEAKARRAAIEARVEELQGQARELPAKVQATLTETYDELVKRGEVLVEKMRKQESTQAAIAATDTAIAKAKTTKTQATKAAKSGAKTASTTAKSAQDSVKKTQATAKRSAAQTRKPAKTATSSAKATVTSAKNAAAATTEAVVDAAGKVGA